MASCDGAVISGHRGTEGPRPLRSKFGSMSRVRLRIATDCSGIDAPVFGLKRTSWFKKGRIKIRQRWASDISAVARQFICANHKPK
eukprot:937845-Pyramimonas_sp.AAC.1